MMRLTIFFAYLIGLVSLLPGVALALIAAAIAWVGLRFVFQILHILLS